MSYQGNRNRRTRRDNRGGVGPIQSSSSLDLPGPLAFLGNPKLFAIIALIAGGSMVFFLFAGALGIGRNSSNNTAANQQMNEAADVPVDGSPTDGTPAPDTSSSDAQTSVKRYTEAPAMTIDTSKTYTATIQTTKGTIQIELYADAAPQAVNAFVFLANDGYYDNTQFMELTKDGDGNKFYAQAGDPTATGLGTPGFSIPKELTDYPFARGYVGMGGSAENSNGGQFFISFGDYPTLDGKYTIFGKVTSGLDVLDQLSLLDLTSGRAGSTAGDEIQSVTITEQ